MNAEPIDPTSEEPIAVPDQEGDEQSIAARVRLGIIIVVAVTTAFAIADTWIAPHALPTLYALKAFLYLTCAWLWWLSRRSSTTRESLFWAVFATGTVVMLVVSISSLITGEDWHPSVLAGALALGLAALIPWSVEMQALLALSISACALVPSVLFWSSTRTVFVLASLTPVPCSIMLAWQGARHRQASRRSLESFRENFQRLRQLTDHIQGVLWLNELNGALLYVSPRFEDIWGQSRSSLYRSPEAWIDAVHPEDRVQVGSWLADAARSGGICEYRLVQPSGAIRWIRDRTFPIVGIHGGQRRIARLSMDITAEREAARAGRMHEFARSIQTALEDERKRIARELHDELGQALTGMKLLLGSLARPAAPPAVEGRDVIQTCMAEIDRSMHTVRAMIHDLRPPVLDELGIAAALRTQAQGLATSTGIRCAVDVPDGDVDLSDEEVTTVFRVAQEALTNVARHAKAVSVMLRLHIRADVIELSIEDDGRGIAGAREDFGLRGMRERAALLNGTLEIQPGNGGGTLVRLRVPRSGAAAPYLPLPYRPAGQARG